MVFAFKMIVLRIVFVYLLLLGKFSLRTYSLPQMKQSADKAKYTGKVKGNGNNNRGKGAKNPCG